MATGPTNKAKLFELLLAHGVANAYAAADVVVSMFPDVEVMVFIAGVTEGNDLPSIHFRMSKGGEEHLDDRLDAWATMHAPKQVMTNRMTAVLAACGIEPHSHHANWTNSQ